MFGILENASRFKTTYILYYKRLKNIIIEIVYIMEEFKKLLAETVNVNTGRGRKPGTVKNYIYMLNSVANQLTDKDIAEDNLSFLLNTEEVLQFITVTHNPRTVRNYITAIMALLLVLDDPAYKTALQEYQIGINTISDQIAKEHTTQKKSVKQEANWTTFKKLQSVTSGYLKWLKAHKVFDKEYADMKPNERKNLRLWLISALYTSGVDNPPVRADYAPMKIITDAKFTKLSESERDQNYLVIGKKNRKYFSFGTYKNVHYYGIKQIPVGKKLNLVLNKYLGTFPYPPEYLLYMQTGTAMDSSGLSASVPKAFEPTGLHININQIRHIFISEHI